MVIIDQMVFEKILESQLEWPDSVKTIILVAEKPIDLSSYAALAKKIKLKKVVIDFFPSQRFKVEAEDKVDGTALAIFTGGTSGGAPKGVRYTDDRWNESKPYLGSPYSAMSIHEPAWSTGKHTTWRAILSGGEVYLIPEKGHVFEINRLVHPEYTIFVPSQAGELYSMYLDFFNKEQHRLGCKTTYNSEEIKKAIEKAEASKVDELEIEKAKIEQAEANALYYAYE